MKSLEQGKVCTKCKLHKGLGDFYTKGSRPDSKCKDCAKKMRIKRYKKKKVKRSETGRLMKIRNVKLINKIENDPLKRKAVCQAVDGVLKDHVYKVIAGIYAKEFKDAP